MEKNPIVDSLWMRCLFEIHDKAVTEGDLNVEFAKVDELVLEYSKLGLPKLLSYLNNNTISKS